MDNSFTINKGDVFENFGTEYTVLEKSGGNFENLWIVIKTNDPSAQPCFRDLEWFTKGKKIGQYKKYYGVVQ